MLNVRKEATFPQISKKASTPKGITAAMQLNYWQKANTNINHHTKLKAHFDLVCDIKIAVELCK